uniref:Uncharacterized protein n=1 Tax=viral metagenome TaxID=1070528 RepID=A0A6H1ZHG3_9ZZZZ
MENQPIYSKDDMIFKRLNDLENWKNSIVNQPKQTQDAPTMADYAIIKTNVERLDLSLTYLKKRLDLLEAEKPVEKPKTSFWDLFRKQ